jgi:hypothetical protein
MRFVIEFGHNHLGKSIVIQKLLDFFYRSSFSNCTFMLHDRDFYKKNSNLYISPETIEKIISETHKKNKRIGLAVCDHRNYNFFSHLNFDFYKLLSVGNTNKNLINLLIKKKRHIYISTGMSNNYRIKKLLRIFGSYKKKTLLHTPMTYKSNELNFPKIINLKNSFNCDVGYSNHNNNFNTLYALSYYNPSTIFLYVKHSNLSTIKYPDNLHSIHIDNVEKLKSNYLECLNSHKINNKKIKVSIFKK